MRIPFFFSFFVIIVFDCMQNLYYDLCEFIINV